MRTKVPAGGRTITIVANDVSRRGGMERVVFHLVRGLLDRDWTVLLVSRTCDVPPAPGLQWIRVPTPPKPFPLAYPLFVLVASVILAFNRAGIVLSNGAIVLNRVDVVTLHFCHHGYGALRGGSRASRNHWLYRLSAQASGRLSLAMERWSYRSGRVRRFIAVSQPVGTEVERAFPGVAPVAVCPNGASLEEFKPDPLAREEVRRASGIAQDDLLAVFAGGDWERKGLRIAIEACGAAGWSLLVVGEGDREAFAACADQAGASVSFVGFSAQPQRELAAGDAFLLPSLYEGFALVAIEAASCGMPLLVTEATGAADLVDSGTAGLILPRTSEAFADALVTLGSNPDARAAMASHARTRARAFSWRRVVDAYEHELATLGKPRG